MRKLLLLLAIVLMAIQTKAQLVVPRQPQLTWNLTAAKYSSNAVFTVYATNTLSTNFSSWPVVTNFPATQNIASTNATNYQYSIPVQLASPALFFTVSVSNQSGVFWCVNPPFCPSDPLLQIGDLSGAGIH